MKRDMELIRRIVQAVADHDDIDMWDNELFELDHGVTGDGKHSNRDVVDYHIWLCQDAGFISKIEQRMVTYYRMTLAGWDFLEGST